MNQALEHFYRIARAHQVKTYGLSSRDPSGRTEHTGGSAAYGFHAVAAFLSAKRTISFRADLRATNKAADKRSKAARKGWKTRQARGA